MCGKCLNEDYIKTKIVKDNFELKNMKNWWFDPIWIENKTP